MAIEVIATPYVIPIHVSRRSTKRLAFFLETEDDDGVVIPYQIPGGVTFAITIRTSQADNAPLAYNGACDIVSATSGQIEVVIPKTAVMGLPDRRTPHYYEIRMTESDGEEFPWFAGPIYFSPTAAAAGS